MIEGGRSIKPFVQRAARPTRLRRVFDIGEPCVDVVQHLREIDWAEVQSGAADRFAERRRQLHEVTAPD